METEQEPYLEPEGECNIIDMFDVLLSLDTVPNNILETVQGILDHCKRVITMEEFNTDAYNQEIDNYINDVNVYIDSIA